MDQQFPQLIAVPIILVEGSVLNARNYRIAGTGPSQISSALLIPHALIIVAHLTPTFLAHYRQCRALGKGRSEGVHSNAGTELVDGVVVDGVVVENTLMSQHSA